MKLSVRGEYALRALLVLGRLPADGVASIHSIANEQRLPRKFLEQILNDLRHAGVVESRRGAAGGYRLARSADAITLAEVIRRVDGALAPVSCVSERFYEKCSCPDETRCPIRSIMKEVRDSVARQMEQTTVSDLVARANRLQTEPMTAIDYVI